MSCPTNPLCTAIIEVALRDGEPIAALLPEDYLPQPNPQGMPPDLLWALGWLVPPPQRLSALAGRRHNAKDVGEQRPALTESVRAAESSGWNRGGLPSDPTSSLRPSRAIDLA